jgi:phenylacetic acid degradation operon negative regulatory protein
VTDHASQSPAERYRYTRRSFDVGFVFGALGADALPGPVLVSFLGRLGLQPSAARNLLTTMRSMGSLDVERVGRIARYRLTPTVRDRYRELEGTAAEPRWHGRFHALLYDIPEKHRPFRDRFRYLVEYAGYGTIRPGVLISPDDRRWRVESRIGELPAGCRIYPTEIVPVDLDQARCMTRDAWDLDALAALYRQTAEALRAVGRGDDLSQLTFEGWNTLYHRLAAFRLQDPHLPAELLPSDWPRLRFAEALDQVNRRVVPTLQPRLREQAAELDPSGTGIYYDSPGSDRKSLLDGPTTETAGSPR